MFDRERVFVNADVSENSFIPHKTILSILSNFIAHKTLTVDDKDSPWFTLKKMDSGCILLITKIKNLIPEKNNVYKSYQNSRNNNNIQCLRRLKLLQEDLHNAIEDPN